jgi:predicted kinase
MTVLWPPPGTPRWSNLAELIADTDVFERGWWLRDPDVAAVCAGEPGLRARLETISAARMVNTTDVYRGSHGQCRPDRAILHARLAQGSCLGSPTPRTHPVAHVTIGCPGAGKTTLLGPLAHAHRQVAGGSPTDVVVVDADAVRRQLPEYNDGLGSQVVQEECFHISYDLVYEQARQTRADLVFDTMGRRGNTEQVVGQLLSAGYSIHLLLAEAPLAQCQRRVQQRALHDGRVVPSRLQEQMHREAAETYRALTDGHVTLAGYAVVDTSMDMGRLRLLESEGAWADDGEEAIRVMMP